MPNLEQANTAATYLESQGWVVGKVTVTPRNADGRVFVDIQVTNPDGNKSTLKGEGEFIEDVAREAHRAWREKKETS